MPSTRPESIINGFGFEAGQASQVIFFQPSEMGKNGENERMKPGEKYGGLPSGDFSIYGEISFISWDFT